MQRTRGSLINLGASHHTAPIDIRERLAVPPDRMEAVYRRLKEEPAVREAAVLSTCNRMELFAVVDDPASSPVLTESVSQLQEIEPDALRRYGFERRDEEAARHLFEVAAGLDSLVIGEAEILGQVKEAYAVAGDHGALGPLLNRLFQKSFQAAKWVRTHTSIGKGQVSAGTVAVDLALKIFGDLRSCRILVVGAGEISERTIIALKSRGAATLTVCNRTDQKAMDLAKEFSGRALPFERFASSIWQYDIVICSTSSPTAILTIDMLREAMKKRSYEPLFLIDLALPRDVEPRAAEVENIFLYNIDDLSQIAEANRALREAEVDRCREALAKRAEHFWKQAAGR